MARHTFFSFHYADIVKVQQVRQAWVTKGTQTAAGVIDSAAFESIERQGDAAIKRWIRSELEGTTVTVVLIGAQTSFREYVEYEIDQSWHRGNGLLGVTIHNMKGFDGRTSGKGLSPFGNYQGIQTYDWVAHDGYNNLGTWVEEAYQRAQRR